MPGFVSIITMVCKYVISTFIDFLAKTFNNFLNKKSDFQIIKILVFCTSLLMISLILTNHCSNSLFLKLLLLINDIFFQVWLWTIINTLQIFANKYKNILNKKKELSKLHLVHLWLNSRYQDFNFDGLLVTKTAQMDTFHILATFRLFIIRFGNQKHYESLKISCT